MIDIAIIITPKDDETKLQRCLYSLRNEQCPIYFIDGKQGKIGHGRAESLNVGRNPYVSFVDPDDEIIPGIYGKIRANLGFYPEVLYHNELIVDSTNGTIHHGWMVDYTTIQVVPERLRGFLWDSQNQRFAHHRGVFKKESALKYEKQLSKLHECCEGQLMQMMGTNGEIKYLNEFGYIWNIHGKNTVMEWI